MYGAIIGDVDPKPYGSWGNGSAMRVSAVGWLYDSIDRTREVAKWTAEVTHNHPDDSSSRCGILIVFRRYAYDQSIGSVFFGKRSNKEAGSKSGRSDRSRSV